MDHRSRSCRGSHHNIWNDSNFSALDTTRNGSAPPWGNSTGRASKNILSRPHQSHDRTCSISVPVNQCFVPGRLPFVRVRRPSHSERETKTKKHGSSPYRMSYGIPGRKLSAKEKNTVEHSYDKGASRQIKLTPPQSWELSTERIRPSLLLARLRTPRWVPLIWGLHCIH